MFWILINVADKGKQLIILIYSFGYKSRGTNEPILNDKNKKIKELNILKLNLFFIK